MQKESYCPFHLRYVIQYLILKESNVKFACASCLLELQDENQNIQLNNIFLLHDIQNFPQKIIPKLSIVEEEYIEYFGKFNPYTENQIREKFAIWEKNVRDFQKMLDQLSQKLQQYDQINFQSISLSFLEVKCEELSNLIEELKSLNENTQIDVIDQISRKIQQQFQDVQRNNGSKLNLSLRKIKEDYQQVQEVQQFPEFRQIEATFNQLTQNTNVFNVAVKLHLNYLNFNPKLITSSEYNNFLFSTIQNKTRQQIKQINQLYLGSRDGLNSQNFQKKVQSKQNLLLIFKSKNPGNYVFGVYTPCQLNYSVENCIKDESLRTFIFSQTHNEIYHLKLEKKQQAIQNSKSYLINLTDFCIGTDFQSGSSSLGNCYYCDKYPNGGIPQNHLFGSTIPNIQDCEVYELQM